MNKNQLITIAVGALFTYLATLLNIGIATADIQNGIVSLVILVWALVGHDANGASSILKNKVALTGIITSLLWFITSVFHVNIADSLKGSIVGVLLYFVGYYTENHSSFLHEIKGTVGEPSPTFAGK